MEWPGPRYVKTLWGWSEAIGSAPDLGRRAVRMVGTAVGVKPDTVVALRYHVDPAASLPKFGKRAASIRCRLVQQCGTGELVEDHHHDRRPGLHGFRCLRIVLGQHELRDRRREQEERSKEERNGAQHRDDRGDRRDPRIGPGSDDSQSERRRDEDRRRAVRHALENLDGQCGEQRPPPERGGRCDEQQVPARREAPAAAGAWAGPERGASASSTMSPAVLSRATKNSGESDSTPNRGWAIAKLHNTPRWTQATRSAREGRWVGAAVTGPTYAQVSLQALDGLTRLMRRPRCSAPRRAVPRRRRS